MKKILVVLLMVAMNIAVSAHGMFSGNMSSLDGTMSFKMSSTVFDVGPQYKNPAIALVFSTVCPGLGQMYNDEVGKGFLFFGTSAFAGGVIYLSAHNVFELKNELRGIVTLVAVAGLATSYIWQWIDAPLTANKKNKENGYVVSLAPSLLPNYTAQNNQFSITPGLGLSFSF